jgi:ribosomal protein S18 acetylase RimI-like enzyme
MNSTPPSSGVRRARFPQDIPQITELVELCFNEVLDYPSRRMLRDVRAVARMGPAAWRFARWVGAIKSAEWLLASIWQEQGRIAANATLTRRAGEADAWLISNVAVHPNFRRRGIARILVEHALGEIRSQGGRNVYLQVDAANESAVRIYRELEFAEIGRRTAWLRAGGERRPARTDAAGVSCRVDERRSSEWTEEYALWREISPAGTAWNTPLAEQSFRPSVWKWIERTVEGETERHFLARYGGRVEAALSAYSRLSGWEGVLIQREGSGGKVEQELLDAAWKAFSPEQSVLLETVPEASVESLVKLGFQKRRTFIWMRYTFPGGAP